MGKVIGKRQRTSEGEGSTPNKKATGEKRRRKRKNEAISDSDTSPMESEDASDGIDRDPRKKHSRDLDTDTTSSSSNSSYCSVNEDDSSDSDDGIINDVLNASTTDNSSDGDKCQRERKKKATNHFVTMKIQEGVTNYRSNLKTAIRELRKLTFTESHLNKIRSTPLWFFFDAIYRHGGDKLMKRTDKVDSDISSIIKCYDRDTESFIIGGKVVPLTCRDVSLIFGVTGGKRKITVENKRGKMVRWVKRHFRDDIAKKKNKFTLSKTHIMVKLEQLVHDQDDTSVVDVARFVHCYLMASVLSPTQNSSVSWPVTEILENFDAVGQYDWCRYIIDVLWKQMNTTRNLKIGGCALLLPYWLCEHTDLVRPKDGVQFPRFMKWDLQKLKTAITRCKLVKIDSKRVFDGDIHPTRDEKRLFKTLIDGPSGRHNRKTQDQSCKSERDISGDVGIDSTDRSTGDKTHDDTKGKDCATPPEEKRDDDAAKTFEPNVKASGTDFASPTQLGEMQGQQNPNETMEGGTPAPVDDTMSPLLATPSFKLHISQFDSARNVDVDTVVRDVIEGLNLPNLGKTEGVDREEFTSIEDVVSEFDDARNKKPTVVPTEGVDSPRKTEPVRSDVELRLLEELNQIKLQNARLAEQIERMNAERAEEKKRYDHIEEQLSNLSRCRNDTDHSLNREGSTMDNAQVSKMSTPHTTDQPRDVLDDTSYPTPTQIFSDPANIARMDDLADMHVKKMEATRLQEEFDGETYVADTQDVGHDTGTVRNLEIVEYQKGFQSPGSIARHVKSRTQIGDRRAKELTPQLSTAELTKQNEHPVVDCEDYVNKQSAKVKSCFKVKNGLPVLDTDYLAMSKVSGHLRSIIISRWNEDQERTVIWRGVRPMSEVTVGDIISILHHDMISNRVVDSWADLLKHKYAETELGKYTTIFSSTCWELIADKGTGRRNTLKHFVDDVIEQSIENDVLMFPLWTKSDGKSTRCTPDHWTLLTLIMHNHEWRFYNSISARAGGSEDVHLKRAKKLVDYVESKIKDIYVKAKPELVLSELFTKPKVVDCLQQESSSVDCGVVVCLVMEGLMHGRRLKRGTLTHPASGNFRKKMVEMFLVSPFFVNGS